MKQGKKSIVLIILSLFILSFTLPPSNNLKRLDETNSESQSSETEEIDDLVKVSEEKEITYFCQTAELFQYTIKIIPYVAYLDYSEYYLEIFLPPPEVIH